MGCGDAGQERTMGTRGPWGRAEMDGQSPMINTKSVVPMATLYISNENQLFSHLIF